MKKQRIKLIEIDEGYLITLTSKSQLSARVFRRATALLQWHQGANLTAVAQSVKVVPQTLARWRRLVKRHRSAAGQMAQAKHQRRSDESPDSSATARLLPRSAPTAPQSLFRHDAHDSEFAEKASGGGLVPPARIFANRSRHRIGTNDFEKDYEDEPPASSGAESRKADD